MNAFELWSPLSPADIAARLTAFGREWRESKLPAGMRSAGFYACSVTVGTSDFSLHLGPLGRGPDFRCVGAILPSPAADITILRGQLELTRTTVWSYRVLFVLALVFIGGSQVASSESTASGLIGAVVALGFGAVMVAVIVRLSVNRFWIGYEAVLREVAQASLVQRG